MTARTPASFDLLGSPLQGTNLIEASAGTGKTYTISGLVLRLLLEAGLTVDRILVVTFTVAATEELRDRVRQGLREALAHLTGRRQGNRFLAELLARCEPQEAAARLRAALDGFDRAPIFTIHGFCQRALAEHAFESGLLFDAELAADQAALRQEVVDDWWRREISSGPALLADFALKRGLGPGRLLALLRSVTCHPKLEVLPPVSAAVLRERRDAFLEAFERVRTAWPGAEEEVEGILLHSKGLSRSKENFGAAGAFVGRLGGCLEGKAPPSGLGALRKVAAGSFREKGVCIRGAGPPEHPFFDLCQELADAEDALFLALEARFVDEAREDLARKKEAQNLLGFDDLLTRLRGALAGPGGPALAEALRARYGAALIDEFQDTDPVQYEIFGRAFGQGLLFLIGDPKQAIYGFRGADVFAYLEAAESAAAKYTLGENWRSDPGLVDGVTALFMGSPRPFVFPRIGFPEVRAADRLRAPLNVEGDRGPPLRVWFAPRAEGRVDKKTGRITKGWADQALPKAVAAEVSRLLDLGVRGLARLGDRPLEPGDLAVLVRKNDEAKRVQEELRLVGVPSVVYSTTSLFAAAEARELERLLLALAEPSREGLVRAALATDLLGVDGEALEALAGDEGRWEGWLGLFRDLHELFLRRGFLPAFRRLLSETGARERLLSFADGERRLTNALHLAEVLHQAAGEERLGPAGLARWLSRRRAEPSAGDEHQLRLESDEKAVKLVTVHRSKGLEFPVTFCPFSWEGSELRKEDPVLFHQYLGPGEGRFALDLGSPRLGEHRGRAEVESLAENLRLLYVALTRAKSRCTLVWGAFNGAETAPLSYLLHYRGEALGASGIGPVAQAARPLSDQQLKDAFPRGTVSVEELPAGPGTAYRPVASGGGEPRARVFGGRIAEDWRIASFTSLASGAPIDADEDAPDRDAAPRPGLPAPDIAGDSVFAFPAGARAGTCLHEILERADFSGGGAPPLADVVAERLAAHGFGPEWRPAAERLVSQTLAVPLEPGRPGFTLSRVPRADRLHEAEFTLPLRQGSGPLTPGALARAFAATGALDLAAAVGPGVLERLGRLEFSPVRGYLRGFVDLVFRFEGRWYLADWKSNRLGGRIEDYGPGALADAMAREHYALQYHLYAAALHRHLAARLPGYDYDRHFGGVFYLFLRGLDPARPGHGVFRDRPPRERVEALAQVLAGEGGRRP